MSIICAACGNQEFFDCEVETVMEIQVSTDGLQVEVAKFEDWHYAEENVRGQVKEAVLSTEKMNADELSLEDYNPYLRCAVCFSGSVCRSFSDWYPRKASIGLDEEMLKNKESLLQLRGERKSYENKLPVLWQP
jgi:sarcosine oxidase delta subunit